MTTGARDAFDTVGDDDQLTDEQLDRLMKQLNANLFDHDEDDGYIGILDGAPITALGEDAILARLGLVNDNAAFEARWGETD